MIAWLTGGSSGLGWYTAQALRKAGWDVVAGARSFREETDDAGIRRLPLDVTDEDSVTRFTEKALAASGVPDAVVLCAGILCLGSCEETSLEEYRQVLETDFLGMVRVTQAVLPMLRERRKGRLILFSSINGLLGIPFQSAYVAAKHAVEGWAECLQMELRPWNVEVCLIEPGDHRKGSSRTRGTAAAMGEDSPYARAFEAGTGVIRRDEANGSDPGKLGEKVARLLKRRRLPLRRRIASADQHLAVWLHDVLPGRLNAWILRGYYHQRKEKGDITSGKHKK